MNKLIFLGRNLITNIIITCFLYLLNESLVMGATNQNGNNSEIQDVVKKIYEVTLPIAVFIAVIKLLISLFSLATSQGDPTKLNNVKDDILSIISGLLVIVEAVTLIKLIAGVLGGI